MASVIHKREQCVQPKRAIITAVNVFIVRGDFVINPSVVCQTSWEKQQNRFKNNIHQKTILSNQRSCPNHLPDSFVDKLSGFCGNKNPLPCPCPGLRARGDGNLGTSASLKSADKAQGSEDKGLALDRPEGLSAGAGPAARGR